jgi:Co/Zn/Cd efflux system component
MMKLLSARFISTVLVMLTLCIILTVIVVKCFINPEAFDKLKELVMALVVAFTGTVSTVINAYFNRQDRNHGGTPQ